MTGGSIELKKLKKENFCVNGDCDNGFIIPPTGGEVIVKEMTKQELIDLFNEKIKSNSIKQKFCGDNETKNNFKLNYLNYGVEINFFPTICESS